MPAGRSFPVLSLRPLKPEHEILAIKFPDIYRQQETFCATDGEKFDRYFYK
jgi:hypothetical protein